MCVIRDAGAKLGVSELGVFVGAAAATGVKEDPVLTCASWQLGGRQKVPDYVEAYCLNVLTGRQSSLLGKARPLKGGTDFIEKLDFEPKFPRPLSEEVGFPGFSGMHDLNCD